MDGATTCLLPFLRRPRHIFHVPAGRDGKPSTPNAANAPPSCPSTAPALPTLSMAMGGGVEVVGAGACVDGDACWEGGEKALQVVAKRRKSPDRAMDKVLTILYVSVENDGRCTLLHIVYRHQRGA
jgi:hypothetical protein